MEFKKCTIGGISYGIGESEMMQMAKLNQNNYQEDEEDQDQEENINSIPLQSLNKKNNNNNKNQFHFEDPNLMRDLKRGDQHSQKIIEFFTLLSLCHTVIPEQVEGEGN